MRPGRTRAATWAAFTAALILTAGCNAARSAPVGMPAPAAAPVGRWLVRSDGGMTPLRQAALDAARDLGRSIAARLRLPQDITVRVGACGREPSGWLRESSEVRLCDETVEGVATALQGTGTAGAPAGVDLTSEPGAGTASEVLRSVTRFLLAQQLGRAVSDLLGLEEGAAPAESADEFAALFLLGDPALARDVRSTARVLPMIGAVRGMNAPGTVAQQARADALLCLAQAAVADDADCSERLKARLAWWENRIGTVRLK